MTIYTAEAPSNIAFVKYWGKRDSSSQWPANDSLSMTLATARTVTSARLATGPADEIRRAGRVYTGAADRQDKGLKHLSRMRQELGFGAPLSVDTHNTFPADCGIASSASGLAALTIAALAAWTGAGTLAELAVVGYPLARLADLSRRGSGSACRSLYGGYVLWEAGATASTQTVNCLDSGDAAWQLADVIAIVSAEAKPVSSTVAHDAAWSSPLFAPRLAGMRGRMARLRAALAARNLDALGLELEAEALEMHAVMMSATPSATYLTAETSKLLAWIRRARDGGGLPAYFTVDAGPNVHVICEKKHAGDVAERLQREFPSIELILDHTGSGPTLTRSSNP